MMDKVADVRGILEAAKQRFQEAGNGEILISCPYTELHEGGEDRNPSCAINEAKGQFNCFTCGSKGSIFKVLSRILVGSDTPGSISKLKSVIKEHIDFGSGKKVDPAKVEVWHESLMADTIMLQALLDAKGITRETVIERRIGKKGDRYTLPYRDQNGHFVLVKSYDMYYSATSREKKFSTVCGQTFITPIDAFEERDILLCEGELKAWLLRQRGFNAVSPSWGAKKWNRKFDGFFSGKHVTILYDNDKPGYRGARTVAAQICSEAESVRIAMLPEFENALHNDVTDYLITCGHSDDELQAVLDAAEKFERFNPDRNRFDPTSECREISVSDIAADDCHEVHASFEGSVAFESQETYKTAAKVEVKCGKDQGETCGRCPCVIQDTPMVAIPPYNPVHLEMIGSAEDKVERVLEKFIGIPRACESHQVVVTQSYSFKMLIVQEKLTWDKAAAEGAKVFMRDPKFTSLQNNQIKLKGWPVRCPKSSEAIFIAYEYENPRRTLENFALTEEEVTELGEAFNPTADSAPDIVDKLDMLYDDYSRHITRIVGRQDMHFGLDLIYHSVLSFNFKGTRIYGPVDGLIIGDTSTGKSEASQRLQEFYEEGARVQVGSSSRAGLLSGVSQISALGHRVNIVAWGVIPTNDRGLVILEEVGLMDEGTMEAMRDVRTSGECGLFKIQSGSHAARTRLVWIGNPKNPSEMRRWAHGVQSIRDISKATADQRRFDFLVTTSTSDVPSRDIEAFELSDFDGQPLTDAGLARKLVRWAWSRKTEDVLFEKEAEVLCIKKSFELGREYSDEIPLIHTTMKDKLARMAVALACRMFSTDDGENVRVKASHVEVIVEWLRQIYSKPSCDYAGMSKRIKDSIFTGDPDEVAALVAGTHAEHGYIQRSANFVEQLLNLDTNRFTASGFAEMAGINDEMANHILVILLRHRAIIHLPRYGAGNYARTAGFENLLRQNTDKWIDKDQESMFENTEY